MYTEIIIPFIFSTSYYEPKSLSSKEAAPKLFACKTTSDFNLSNLTLKRIYSYPSMSSFERSGEKILKCSRALPGKHSSRFSKVSYSVFINIPSQPRLLSVVS